MIKRAKTKHDKKQKLCNKLMSMNAYAVESETDKDTIFIATGDEFAIVRNGDAILCDVSEIPTVAERFIKPIKDEILLIYDDLKDLHRMEMNYAVKYKGDLYV